MLSLVIPVYKNEESLPRLLREISALAPRCPGGLEVVFVVDGSPDRSLDVLGDALPTWDVPAQLVELSRNFGSFSAIAAGLAHGRGASFAVMAADLQEPPELVLEFERLLSSGAADIVFGYRQRRADPLLSRTLSALFWGFYRRFVVPDMPKGGIDVFACTRQVRDRVMDLKEVDTSLVALLLWVGFRRVFVPYERQARQEGRSAWTFARKFRYALDSVFNFTDLPIKLLLGLGAVTSLLALVGAIVVVIAWASGLVPVLGYTPLMLAVISFGGFTALGLGIVGQYVWLSLQNSRNRPNFIVRASHQFGASGQAETTDRKSS
ncbi:MAG: glycosyltransferase family 2 protein [Acidobacteriota bacterium]